MKSAIEIVAFSHGSPEKGLRHLLEVSRDALDRNGFEVASAYLEMALDAFNASIEEQQISRFDGLPYHH
ncbi:hypothetical protein [Novosphingobium olei]|uniref:Uncharacterized protein n=1 Tax=Novosphingobium olei TaxID=2728851 RepID=A0A7Y0BTG3_9SPHN|nr:hypothetical protein [Novosphingobium olei]NML96259.1 hypothetical protein [Novosphingobium olei]